MEVSLSREQTVLVLGAYGDAGRAVVAGLRRSGHFDVIAAGRNPDKLRALQCAGVQTVQLDVRDPDALTACLARAGLVINCVGPYIGTGAAIARAAQESGLVYLDIASEQEHYRRVASLIDPQGPIVLVGAGAYPGLSGLLLQALVARFPGAQVAELALIAGPPRDPSAGHAQSLGAIIELAYPHESVHSGRRVTVRLGSRCAFRFPQPFGEREVLVWPQLETFVFANQVDLGTHVGLGQARLPSRWVLRALSWVRPVPGSIAYRVVAGILSRRAAPSSGSRLQGLGSIVAVVHADGERRGSILARDLSAATAWLPLLIAERWRSGDLEGHGLVHAADVLDVEATLDLARASSVFEVELAV